MPAELPQTVDHWHIIGKPADATGAGILLSAIFLAGALIDSVRTVTIQPIVSFIVNQIAPCRNWPVPRGVFDLLNKDSREIFELISDKANEYLRLNQNITLTLFTVLVARAIYDLKSWPTAVALLLFLLWLGISICQRQALNFAV